MGVIGEAHHWWWAFVPLFWFAFIVLFFGFLGPRFLWRRHHHHGWHHGGGSPESVLGERYARGEIDEQEYRSRLEVLREGRR
jgi:putative membrane protein